MSDEVISPSKKLYTRDFLMRYSTINREEPQIADKFTPDVSSPQLNTTKKISSSQLKTASTGTTINIRGAAKTPNPRKTGTALVYSQKENVPTQTPLKIGSSGVDSFTTPVRKALAPRPFKSPIRKTWVAATTGTEHTNNGQSSSFNFSEKDIEFKPVISTQSLPEQIFMSPIKPVITHSDVDPLQQPLSPSTPARSISVSSQPIYLSPKSTASTPFKSPTSPGFSPSKSPGRPISPLDEQRLSQRQKQIDYGYRTVGYLRYRLMVTKDQRKPEHPRTPKKTQGCSKRSWDGQLKKWRRDLHLWDPDNTDAFKALLNSDLVVSIIAANPELAEIVDIVKEKIDNPNSSEYDEFDESSTDNNFNLPSEDNGFIIDKKVTPPSSGDDASNNKGQSKVARSLVFY